MIFGHIRRLTSIEVVPKRLSIWNNRKACIKNIFCKSFCYMIQLMEADLLMDLAHVCAWSHRHADGPKKIGWFLSMIRNSKLLLLLLYYGCVCPKSQLLNRFPHLNHVSVFYISDWLFHFHPAVCYIQLLISALYFSVRLTCILI